MSLYLVENNLETKEPKTIAYRRRSWTKGEYIVSLGIHQDKHFVIKVTDLHNLAELHHFDCYFPTEDDKKANDWEYIEINKSFDYVIATLSESENTKRKFTRQAWNSNAYLSVKGGPPHVPELSLQKPAIFLPLYKPTEEDITTNDWYEIIE